MKTTTPTALPSAVTRYLAAANRHDARAAADCFTSDATVHDESHDHVGRDAVRRWLEETGRKYLPAYTLMRADRRGDQLSLSVAVAGRFPGSPVTLDYELRLQDGKIASLTIA
ncbi:MAG TPA: nuclear transport factor 2 family protein [Opitutaceae bacterium]|nr:nuclear transport factor 2 family protein [Opitutaceae bacterium]